MIMYVIQEQITVHFFVDDLVTYTWRYLKANRCRKNKHRLENPDPYSKLETRSLGTLKCDDQLVTILRTTEPWTLWRKNPSFWRVIKPALSRSQACSVTTPCPNQPVFSYTDRASGHSHKGQHQTGKYCKVPVHGQYKENTARAALHSWPTKGKTRHKSTEVDTETAVTGIQPETTTFVLPKWELPTRHQQLLTNLITLITATSSMDWWSPDRPNAFIRFKQYCKLYLKDKISLLFATTRVEFHTN